MVLKEVNLEKIVDGDGHLNEDIEAIARLMPTKFRDRLFSGKATLLNQLYPPIDHFHSAMPVEVPEGSFAPVGVDGWVDFADDVGIDSAVLYPSAGLAFGNVVNMDWAIALAQAYNNWLYETYLKRDSRFKAVGLIPMQDPAEAVKELRRCVQELGMVGAMLPSNGFKDHLGAKDYWPVYEEANRLKCAMAVHGGSHENYGFDHMNVYAPVHALGHPFGQMIGFAGLIFNGVFDKFPEVKWGFLEGGISWFMLCLERFDRSYETHIHSDPREELIQLRAGERVSDYIKRNIDEDRIYVGCEGNEPFIPAAVRAAGDKFLFFSSDFPHEVNNEMCKHELQEVLDQEGIDDAAKAGIRHANSETFYRLNGS